MELINMELWLTNTIAYIGNNNIASEIGRIGTALVLASIAWNSLSFWFWKKGMHPFALLIRSGFAFAIIANATPITQTFANGWLAIYNNLAKDQITAVKDAVSNFGTTLESESENIALAGVLGAGPALAGTAGVVAGTATATSAIASKLPNLASGAKSLGLKALLGTSQRFLMGIISIYFTFLVATGFAIVVGGLLLPITAGAAMTPIGDTAYIRWTSIMAVSYVGVIMIPLLTNSAITLTVVGPLNNLTQSVIDLGDQVENLKASSPQVPILGSGINQIAANWIAQKIPVQNAVNSLFGSIEAIGQATFGTVGQFITGFAASIFLMFAASYYINAYAGSLAATIGNSATAMFDKMLSGGGSSISVGGSSNNSSTSAGSSSGAPPSSGVGGGDMPAPAREAPAQAASTR